MKENLNEKKKFFADTYAFIELHKGNPLYEKHSKQDWVTSEQVLVELYFTLLRTFNHKTAYRFYLLNKERTISLTDEVIVKAMHFKLVHKNEKLSYTDCLGYAQARELDIPFLTGDIKFKNKKGVLWAQ